MRVTHASLGLIVLLGMGACTPLHDLDKVSSGRRDAAGVDGERPPTDGEAQTDGPDAPNGAGGAIGTDGALGTGGGTGTGGALGDDAMATGDAAIGDAPLGADDVAPVAGGAGGSGASGTGGVSGTGGQATGGVGANGGAGGTAGSAGAGGTGGSTGTLASDLPEIFDSPVTGVITYSADASWTIDGTQWPTFEIHTPTANYWLMKAAAAMVSITDSSGLQWINYSSFRPNRGVPNLGGCCKPGDPAKLGLPTMTTELDPAFTITSTHLRLLSKSADASYWLVWDFYLTHFTLTINRAGRAFGFTYSGVPGGAFDGTDHLVLSDGRTFSATTALAEDIRGGPAEWAYLTHPPARHSLFLIQHADDALAESYQITDNDTGMFVFGGGRIVQTPIRFSLGLVDSAESKPVEDRIAFVRNATPAP